MNVRSLVAMALLWGAGSVWGTSQARPGEDKLLARFVGKWEAEGKHMGTPMKAAAEYGWALGKQFLKGDVRIASGNGKFLYESTIYIRPTDKEGVYSLTWLDSMGNTINSSQTLSGKTLTMEWMEKTPVGECPAKSEMTLLDEGWIDRSFIKQSGAWVELGSLTFKKQ